CDWQYLVANAKYLGTGGGIVERFSRSEFIGQHQAAHALRTQCIDRHRRAQCRIDASGQTQNDAWKSILVYIIAKAQYTGSVVGAICFNPGYQPTDFAL